MASGQKNPIHSQTVEEVMVMLSGEVQVEVDGVAATMQAGDVLTVPARVPHSIENTSAAEAQWLIISPAPMQFHGPEGKLIIPDWAR